MNNSELKDLFKERYYFESDRQDRLKSNVGIPLSILTLIFGLIGLMLTNFYIFNLDLSSIIFYIFFLITGVLFIYCVIFLFKSFFNYEYYYLPGANEIKKYLNELEKYYEAPYFNNLKKSQKESRLRSDIHMQLAEYYCEAAEKNMQNNEKRSKNLHIAIRFLIITLISLILASIPFFYKYTIIKKIEANKTFIIKGEIKMEKEKNDEKIEREPSENKKPPPKPEPPPLRLIKEGEDKPQNKGGKNE